MSHQQRSSRPAFHSAWGVGCGRVGIFQVRDDEAWDLAATMALLGNIAEFLSFSSSEMIIQASLIPIASLRGAPDQRILWMSTLAPEPRTEFKPRLWLQSPCPFQCLLCSS